MATTSIPQTANDVLVAFSEALGAAQDSEEQVNTLAAVRTALDDHPEYLSAIYSTLLSVTARSGAVLLRWIADVVELVIARLAVLSNALSVEQRTHMTIQSIDAILLFLDSPDFEVHKLGLQCFASAYPVLLRHACMSPSDSRSWEKTSRAKGITLNAWRNGSIGSRIAAMKAVQKIIQSQTRATADPRLQNRGDMNLSMCPSTHPFVSSRQLEEEGNKLLEESTSLLFASNVPDIISALVNACTILVKARPTLSNRIMAALTSWTPNAISGLSAVQIKSVEKTVRLALYYLFRSGSANAFASQINDFMQRQDARMRIAHDAEIRRKEDEASLKRARIADDLSVGPDFLQAKRRRLEDGTSASPTPPPGALSAADRQLLQTQLGTLRQAFDVAAATAVPAGIKSYDVTQVPSQTVMELVIANLLVMTEEALKAASATAKTSMGAAADKLLFGDAAPGASKSEPVAFDPLKAELDEDDLEGRARAAEARERQDQAALAAAEAEAEADFSKNADGSGDASSLGLPGTAQAGDRAGDDNIAIGTILSQKAKSKLLHTAIERIVAAGKSASGAAGSTNTAYKDLWLQLIARLATRGLSDLSDETEAIKVEKNNIRKQIFDHIVADIPERIELARLWLNEEWYTQTNHTNDETAKSPQYEPWLRKVLDSISNSSIIKETGAAFTQFFVDLPEIPASEMQRIEKMCLQTASLKVGFMTLRDLAMLRPPMRSIAMDILLGLATHSEKPIRGTAILTIKRWVPDVQPLGQMGVDFALQVLRRLESTASRQVSVSRQPSIAPVEGTPAVESAKPVNGEVKQDEDSKDEMQVDASPNTAATVKDGVIISGLEHARNEGEVAQHIELLFGLVSKAPQLLDELFKAYPRMSADVQQIIQQLCIPLIRSLGPNNAKVQSIVESYPDGSEDLVFKMLTILTDKGKLPTALAAHIRKLASEKDMSPRFLVPIIAEFDKAEITKHLPRIVSTLDGKQAGKDVVRSVLSSIVTTPPQNFGTSSSNAPRARQSDLFTPVELLVLLHLSEKEIGLKQAIEAISICFSMSDTFRPEVLAAFMQQVIDEPSLPTLFLRTVIQAVTTYKSLVPYVSKTLLARLITKKIWTMPQLWQGFIRCAKVIAPHSYDAILQLPKEQIKELVAKQPDLRDELIDHVKRRAGVNQQRSAPLLEILQGEA